MTRRLAYPPAPLQGPPPGLLRPRSGQTARDAFGAGSGTDPGRPLPARHVRHRPGPVTRPSPAFRLARNTIPARWLAFHRRPRELAPRNRCRQRNPDGLRLPEPRAPRQCTRPRAFPPACIETFAIHPAAGVERVWHGGRGCGKGETSVGHTSCGKKANHTLGARANSSSTPKNTGEQSRALQDFLSSYVRIYYYPLKRIITFRMQLISSIRWQQVVFRSDE
jgi:hypothetical protein